MRTSTERLTCPRSALAVVTLTGLLAAAGTAQHVVGRGEQVFDSAWSQEPLVEVAAGADHTVAPTRHSTTSRSS